MSGPRPVDPRQLLPRALQAHSRGDLAGAGRIYERILAAHPEHPDTLQFLGILRHQQGESTQGEALIRAALARAPGVAAFHDNLATVLSGQGRHSEALAEYDAAARLDAASDDPEREFNRGVTLIALSRAQEAAAVLRALHRRRPGDAAAAFELGNALRDAGDDTAAEEAYRATLSVQPGHAGARINLAGLVLTAGDRREGERLLESVTAAEPQFAVARLALAQQRLDRGDATGAIAALEGVPASAPRAAARDVARARALELLGRLGDAAAVLRARLRRGGDGDGDVDVLAARRALLRILGLWSPTGAAPDIDRLLEQALSREEVPVAAVARCVLTRFMVRHPDAGESEAAARSAARAAEGEPALLRVLAQVPVAMPEAENWLTAVRRMCAGDAGLRESVPGLLGALSLQCRCNEFVFAVESQEREQVEALAGRWRREPRSGNGDTDLLMLACYGPVHAVPGFATWWASHEGGTSPLLARLVTLDRDGPDEERRLAAGLRSLAPVRDGTSEAVRALYEGHPYPRWTELPAVRGASGLAAVARAVSASRIEALSRTPLEVLVAGCGTGQEVLELARYLPGARITALDLSLSSLGYAARMARALGIGGVEFVHGDLLDVDALGQRYDVITASGVIHHLREPARGLAALRNVLADDGLLKLGLYSARARRSVAAARALIAREGLSGVDDDGVRSLRARILDREQAELAALLDSEDFYTMSGARDLLLHPMEHRYDLDGVAELLAGQDLEFLGFELPHVMVRTHFLREFPGRLDDLDAWSRFEAAHPDTFAGMYLFWSAPRGPVGDGR